MSDPFDDIVNGLDISVDQTEIVDVSRMDTVALIELKQDLDNELMDSEQALRPVTQDSRDAHSLRNAVQVELAKRTQGNG